jgi:hypothetical protein
MLVGGCICYPAIPLSQTIRAGRSTRDPASAIAIGRAARGFNLLGDGLAQGIGNRL